MNAGPWIATYIGAILVWSIVLAAGASLTLWRGSSLLFLNGAFVVASLAVVVARRVTPTIGLAAFDAVLLGSAVLVRDVWLALHVEASRVEEILEECFARTRASYTRAGAAYLLTVAGAEMRVMVDSRIPGTIQIGFAGNSSSKKAQLIRSLIGKQFRGSFPAIKLRA